MYIPIPITKIDKILTLIDQEGLKVPPAMTTYRRRQLVEAVCDKLVDLNVLKKVVTPSEN